MNGTEECYEPWSCAGFRGRALSGWAAAVGDREPLSTLLEHPHETVKSRRGKLVYRIDLGGRVIYAKRTWGSPAVPGFRARLDALRRLARPSRAMKVWRTHRAMVRAGLSVPRILAAGYRRRGLDAEDLVISQEVAGQGFARVLVAADSDGQRRLMRRLGRSLARMHRAGWYHGDPGFRNIVIAEGARCCWLDNDHTRWLPDWAAGAARRHNLGVITHQALWRCRSMHVRTFFEAYGRVLGWEPAPLVAMMRSALAFARARSRLPGRGRRPYGEAINI